MTEVKEINEYEWFVRDEDEIRSLYYQPINSTFRYDKYDRFKCPISIDRDTDITHRMKFSKLTKEDLGRIIKLEDTTYVCIKNDSGEYVWRRQYCDQVIDWSNNNEN